MPSSACAAPPPHPHSFPTRRSSDLVGPRNGARCAAAGRDPRLRRHRQRPLQVGRAARHRAALPAGGRHARGLHGRVGLDRLGPLPRRSEEHTSELQSQSNLVCRLLLAPPPPPIHTLSLHDALPILWARGTVPDAQLQAVIRASAGIGSDHYKSDVLLGIVQRFRLEGDTRAAFMDALASIGSGHYRGDRKSTRLNSSHSQISYAVFCLRRPPPPSTLFPYTTLFRSCGPAERCPMRSCRP